jgi:purine-binding chemotaxis protein CheW
MHEINALESEATVLVSTFLIGEARFAIDANKVQEVVQIRKTTVVHHAPPFIKGVLNLRGRVITVIDLGEKLDLGSIEQCADNRIMIVEWKQEYIGLLVERITEVIQVERNSIKRPPENVHGVQANLIAGVFLNELGHLVGLLDIDKVLAADERESVENTRT